MTKEDDVQKECNAAWDQLKKNNPTDEGLTEATNKKIEELRRKNMKQKFNFFNVWTKTPAKHKRNEDAIAAEENVQSPTNSAVAEAPSTSSTGEQQSQPAPSAPPSTVTLTFFSG